MFKNQTFNLMYEDAKAETVGEGEAEGEAEAPWRRNFTVLRISPASSLVSSHEGIHSKVERSHGEQKFRTPTHRYCLKLTEEDPDQCDQIGQFIGLWAFFQSLWQQLICPNLLQS